MASIRFVASGLGNPLVSWKNKLSVSPTSTFRATHQGRGFVAKSNNHALTFYYPRGSPSVHSLLGSVRKLSTQQAPPPPLGSRAASWNSVQSWGPSGDKWSRRHWWFRRLATFVRYVRIPALILGVYTLGYQQGLIDCTAQPKALQEKVMAGILAGQGVTDMSHVQVVGDWEVRKFSGDANHQVALVGQKIIQAAKDHVQIKLAKSMAKVRANLPEDMDEKLFEEYYAKDEDCVFWSEAGTRLIGEGDRPWQYVFIKTGIANAFVTEMLPQRFFVTTGLLDMASSVDELAFVLGHEVSHLLLGHVSQANRAETMLRTIEVLLLSIDPTAGVLSLFFIGGLAAIRRGVTAAFSRDNEREADDLGVEIAARACFDTVAGAEVMKKMHYLSTLETTPMGGATAVTTAGVTLASMYDSHPPTQERYDMIKKKAVQYNKEHHSHCHSIIRRLFNSAFGKARSHIEADEAMSQMSIAKQSP
mmetsp:Transcript_6482/g.13350  ORF Transcript_6482/g.13350 Transcript_6482/m.13350 type:complete len:475 (-) Transcript_6482:42-1466(-)